jgi:starch-binding outer membrane protein, SusD/RagB family
MHKNRFILLFCLLIFFASCNKTSFLAEKPKDSLIVPETIEDLQMILDNTYYMNGDRTSTGVNPVLGEISSDDYFLTPSGYTSLSTSLKSLYKWEDDFYNNENFGDWSFPYRAIFYSNVILDNVDRFKDSENEISFNNVKGSALFYRAEMLFGLSQIFAPVYDKNTEETDLGLVLKLKSDISEEVKRSSIKETYRQFLSDLKTASELLPAIAEFKTRPSKPAAYALLARAYLSMRDYDSAFKYSNSCLSIIDTLIDYNGLSSFPLFFDNPEVVFYSVLCNTSSARSLLTPGIARVDSNLFSSYDNSDLRKNLFFGNGSGNSGKIFRGGYSGRSNFFFGGLATDEMYLTRAECYARNGNIVSCLNDLNKLLKKRWSNSTTYSDLEAIDSIEALRLVLIERRKQLIYRGIRWIDIRRLNKEGANIVLTRRVGDEIETLNPNSTFYTFLIPPDVINFHPTMPQNVR